MCPFDQGGGCEVVGIEMAGRDTGVMSGSHTFVRFGSKSGMGLIVWLGDSRWGGNGGGRWQWLYAMVMELKTARLRCWHHIWQPYVHGFGLRVGGLNWVVGVEAVGKVVAAVHCGGGWEI